MRNYAAAEHALHALLAADGARTCYPKISHTVRFSKTDDIVRNIVEIAHALEKKGWRGNSVGVEEVREASIDDVSSPLIPSK